MESLRTGQIVRSQRDGFSGELESIYPAMPYMQLLDHPDEESGVLLNDQVDEEANEIVDSDFVETYEPDFEDEPPDDLESTPTHPAMHVIDIGDGIQIKTIPSLAEQLILYKASKWSNQLRNSLLNVSNLRSDNKFATNVYKLTGKPKLSNINNPNEKNLLRKKQCVFSLIEKYKDQVWFRVPLDTDVIPTEEAMSSTFSAWIECGDDWRSVPAIFKDGYVEFACCRLNSFAIVCRPAAVDHIITPAGGKLLTTEGKAIAEFEPGTVDIEQKLKYTIKRPNHKNIQRLIDSKRRITGVSDRISITQCDTSKFKKRMTLLSGTLENGTDFESTVEVIGFIDNKPVLMTTEDLKQQNDQCEYRTTMDISNNGAAFVQIRNNGQENAKIIESLRDEIDVAYGDKYLCKILLFYRKREDKMLYFTAECCFSHHADTLKQEHIKKQNRLIYESEELCLPPHQRLRIHPTGCIQHVTGVKSHIFLFFMYVVYDNWVDFTVEICKGMSRSVNATLEFSADNQRRGEMTKAEFSLDSFYGANEKYTVGRPLYKRTNSTMSDIFRQQPTTPRTPSKQRPQLRRSNTTL